MAGLLSAATSIASDCEDGARWAPAGTASGVPVIALDVVGPSVQVNVACHFTAATGSDSYMVSSTDALMVAASLDGTLLTLDPGYVKSAAQDTATVTVSRGSESYVIQVAVSSCVTATAGSFPGLVVNPGRARTWDWNAADYFAKARGSALTYGARSSNTDTVTVALSGTQVTLTGGSLPPGTDKTHAELILTASNNCGAARAQVEVTLQQKSPPQANTDHPIADTTMTLGDDPVFIHLPPHFIEEDGDALTYSASHSPDQVLATVITGMKQDSLEIRLGNTGNTGDVQVKASASDPEGQASQQFTVTVETGNRAPAVHPMLRDTTLASDGYTATIALSEHFSDPDDGDKLTYTVSSLASGTATGSETGGVLTITTGGTTGMAKIAVEAEDQGGLTVSDTLEVAVTENVAPVVEAQIPDVSLHTGATHTITLSGHFEDPDGKDADLAYTAESDAATVMAGIADGVLTVTSGSTPGEAEIVVEATDPGGLTVTDTLEVTVGCRVNPPIDDITLVSGGSKSTITLSDHFSGHCANATYTQSSSATRVATGSIADGVLTVTSGNTTGTATITVTASVPDATPVSDAFVVTVTGCAITVNPFIADRSLPSGSHTTELTLSEHFSASNCADAVTYRQSSSATRVATGSIASGVLTVTSGSTTGDATITVTATSGTVSVSDDFVVTVTQNIAPRVKSAIVNTSLAVGGKVATYTLASHFEDPDFDNSRLHFAASSNDNAAASVSIAANSTLKVTSGSTKAGSATVTVTATDPGGLAVSDDFVVTVTNQAPRVKTTIGDQIFTAGGAARSINLSQHFSDPERQTLSYSATVGLGRTTRAVRAQVSGSTLALTPLAAGTATVTVTATDPPGAATPHSFPVTVNAPPPPPPPPNRAPSCDDDRVTLTLDEDDEELDMDDLCSDPDNDALTYALSAVPSGSAASATLSGSDLTIAPEAAGAVTITVTATDDDNASASSHIAVIVHRAPTCNAIAVTLTRNDDDEVLDLDDYCSDPDNDALTYALSAVPSGSAASITRSGSDLTVSPEAVGSVTATVTATDSRGATATSTVSVTVQNQAPETAGSIATVTIGIEDAARQLGVSAYFTDPDGDALTYDADSDRPGTVTAEISGSTLTLTPVAPGTATVTVTATDQHDAASPAQTFTVTIVNGSPTTTGTIAGVTLQLGGSSQEIDVSSYFSDPDGHDIEYSAASTGEDVVSISLSGSTLTLAPESAGSVTISVTAEDTYGAVSPAQTFPVTVVNGSPTTTGTIADVTLQLDGSSQEIDVSSYFSDPDGHDLEYSAASTDEDVVSTSLSGSTLTLAPESAGSVTISVTAEDTYGAVSPSQTFSALVNRSPTVTDEIDDLRLLLTESEEIDLSQHFSDPDGHTLTYATSSTGAFVDRSVSGSTLPVTAEAVGSATVTVTASDGNGGSVETDFTVTIRGTPTVNGTMPNRTLTVNGLSVSFDVASYFTEPDGDTVTYSARLVTAPVRIPDYVSLRMSGSTLTLTPGTTTGSIAVEVKATDSDGSATQSFTVTVSGGF